MGTKRPNCRRDWHNDLVGIGARVGFDVITWDPYPARRSKVLIRCKHSERWVFPHATLNVTSCCKSTSKVGSKNPAFDKPAWNSGTVGISTGHGFGGQPSDSERLFPGILYLIRYLDESGTHFKLGITKRSLNERFKPHQLISIIHLHYATLGECFDLEQELLKWAKDSGYRYSSSTTTELIHPAAIPLLLKNDCFNSIRSEKGLV